ncbi:stage II sporulation protein R [Sporolituus thermophilus]|uniref:Stage II sporulation protein R n=1 Tax=Sporolituus thermophilus DSM 23256 TaxID=1123285 RepID=A0A1G7I2F5_9FIRM|nr:stage II sporulation protein R [Sporolituus thermophilus]SDF06912.1 stage II sporulation protein R [Sporolituus thermophilus DSM 23256]
MRRNLLHQLVIFAMVFFIVSGWALLFWQGRESGMMATSRGELIRLHVLANSDSPADQQLKREVRDAVLAYLAPKLEQAGSASAARRIINAERDNLREAAKKVLTEHNSADAVEVQIGWFDFPVKSYGDLVLPAGKYEAVRILIGKAEGQNWWCVLFPPLCFIDMANAAAVPAVKTLSEGNEKIQIRWKVAEFWQRKDESRE